MCIQCGPGRARECRPNINLNARRLCRILACLLELPVWAHLLTAQALY